MNDASAPEAAPSRRPWRRSWLLGAVLLLGGLAIGVALVTRPGPGTTAHRLRVGDRERTYLLHVPSGAPPGPLPLVLALHGASSSGWQMERLTRFSPLADREHFLVAYPDGIGHRWRDGRPEIPEGSS